MTSQDIIGAIGTFTNAINHDSTFENAYIQLAIENDIVIRKEGPEDLIESIPIEVEEIEALMSP